MCKGPKDRGGPYRCSGDMASEYERASARFTQSLLDTQEPQEAKARADAAMARVEAQIEMTDDDHQLEVLHAAREQFGQEQQACDRRCAAAQATLREAVIESVRARDASDATPRGVASLQSRIDSGDTLEGEVERRDAGLSRMNAEARERDERWGSDSGVAVPIHLYPSASENWKATYADMASQDRLSASCTDDGYVMDPESGREGRGYTVTFYRSDEESGRTKHMKVRYLSSTGSAEPTQADVLARMSQTGADYESHRNFSTYCKETGVGEEERDAARADYQDGKRYSRQLNGFFGARAVEYMATARAQRAASGQVRSE